MFAAMFTTILLCALLGSAAASATSTPSPTTTADPSVQTQVRAQTFKEAECGGAYEFLWIDPNVCYGLSDGVKSIRVVGKDGDIKYNALNTYPKPDCGGGFTLLPIYGTKTCFSIDLDVSIKLSIGQDP
ncbi:hypothetical protein J4E83_006517 [Alternaria metachromatica]|uniref:uncharacterized protein n=1 Tax=Alternaria metachromatica TaxID=283354 RepID=UPI0020C218F3|nr:uncharacterized protein J4E83_006517 [Alternaria metachromatica]KAI4616935.1 hypothetical protein J4E83_006517 [Alternaria metachromatica]